MTVTDLHDAATAPTGPSELQSFYVALREAFSVASDGLVGMLEERHQEHRALTRRIRELLQIAEDAEDAVFVALHQARGGVDGVEPDLAVESEHWQNGAVRFSWEEPAL